jgi:molybdopterin/thiamine biosynthesis adenylyltransferase
VRPWFERDPELLAREISELERLGAIVSVDEEALTTGTLRLQIEYSVGEATLRLLGIYPDLYPFFRPEVLAPDLALPRHQQPISKALCLIGRRTSKWYAEDTLATLLREQLPHLLPLVAGAPIEAVVPVEEPQGEPASDYYNAEAPRESFLLFDGSWSIDPTVMGGVFQAQMRKVARDDRPELTVQGYITKISGMDGRTLAEWQGPRLSQIDDLIEGRWLRLNEPILGDINQVLDALGDERQQWLKDERRWPNHRHLALSAVLYPEEVQHRVFADGWLGIQWLASRRHRGFRQTVGTFVRTSRAGPEDLAARMPATRALQDRSVAFFGTGAIGAPAALELARAGVGRLLLVDHDMVDPSTIRRWPLGLSALGALKVDVLKRQLADDYPWTEVEADTMKIGAAEVENDAPQGARLAALLEGQDLVIDCTAELGVNHLLSELARVRGIPYVLANATPGGWGGMVASFTGAGPCWLCLRHALYTEKSIPLPPADPAGELQPPGCADPTFTGSAFDLTEVGLELVRTAAGILTGAAGGYPLPTWHLAVLHLRDAEGQRVPPSWQAVDYRSRPSCGCRH